MKSYSISFHPEAKDDLKNFNYSVQLLILKQIKKLSVSPELGEALGNKYGLNLTGLRKMYVSKKQVRIVYQIFESKVEVLIIGIGKRESNIIYETVSSRIEKK
jgi:mRNA interferase RelE/StbE